jgi:hypothetical protein
MLVLLPAVPVRAATAAPSCVDLDNDGTCGVNEPALGPVLIQADNRLSFGLNDQFKAPNSGGISLYSFQGITAMGLNVIAGDIDIESFPPEEGHIPGREITLTNSLINQSSADGSLTMLAGDTFEPKDSDRITFINTRVIARGGFADIEPEPVIS